MASVECRPHGYTACTFGNAKRQTKEEDANTNFIAAMTAMLVVLFVIFCFAVFVCYRVFRNDSETTPEANNDIELGAVPQRDAPAGPTVPQLVAITGRHRSISPAPPPYRKPSPEDGEDDPAVDGNSKK